MIWALSVGLRGSAFALAFVTCRRLGDRRFALLAIALAGLLLNALLTRPSTITDPMLIVGVVTLALVVLTCRSAQTMSQLRRRLAGETAERQEAERRLEEAREELGRHEERRNTEPLYLGKAESASGQFSEIVGESAEIRRMLEAVEQVAAVDSTVLVVGETGVGKELVARAIHELGSRRDKALVKVNCASLPASLVESELFGHEKGAFTGASTRRPGRFELADGGTLFLDEIGELPRELQPKLLRVLQEGELQRVGSDRTRTVDVRVIVATNRDLSEEVAAGRFRADLFYRLNVFPIEVPPLRARPGDVLILASYFLKEVCRNTGKSFDGFTGPSVHAMTQYPWPGNVRELRNVVERAAVSSDGPLVDLTPFLGDVRSSGSSPLRTLEEVERQHIETVLREVGGVVEGENGAARLLGIHPSTLRSRMRKLGVSRPA